MKNLAKLLVMFCFAVSNFSYADFKTDNDLVLNGIATHYKLKKPLFIASLNVTDPITSEAQSKGINTPAQMHLTILKDRWSKRQFRQYWLSGIAINAGVKAMGAHQDELIKLATSLQSGLKKNDAISLNFTPEQHTKLLINGVEIDTFSPQLFSLLLTNWFGPRVDKDYRHDLLNLSSNASELIATVENATASGDRVDTIKEWLVAAEEVEIAKEAAEAQEVVVSTGPTPEEIAAEKRRKEIEEAKREAKRIAKKKAEERARIARAQAELEARQAYESALYSSQILASTNRNVVYPRRAESRNQTGKVLVSLTVNRKGEVLNKEVIESSGHRLLDKASLKAIDRVGTFPGMPEILPRDEFTTQIPITFILKK